MPRFFGQDFWSLESDWFQLSRTNHRPGQVAVRHNHDEMCMHFVLRGLYIEHAEHQTVAACPGMVVIKTAGQPHWNTFGPHGATSLRIVLRADAPWQSFENLDRRRTDIAAYPYLRGWDSVERLIAQVQGGATPEDLNSKVLSLVRLLTSAESASNHCFASNEVHAAGIIAQCERWDGDVDDLARSLGANRCHLARSFQRRFGCSMTEYAGRIKAASVARRLARGEMGLARIALQSGYADQSHLTRFFNRHFGAPPRRWIAHRRRTG